MADVHELLDTWLANVKDEDLLAELKAMKEAGDEDAITDAFFQDLEFGTAGLRGTLGAGFREADGAVMCAAVADYTPVAVADRKITKGDGEMTITLRRTRDIAAELGADKRGRLLVGFALETHDEEAHAEAKLAKKHFDFIVLNSLRDAGAGFRGDTNKVTFINAAGREPLPLMSKRDVAARIADKIESLLK